ncbi:MAG TPA: universal stress protein [Marmoricola sp.]|nr:universal stress protein [Marmoricola sp.]
MGHVIAVLGDNDRAVGAAAAGFGDLLGVDVVWFDPAERGQHHDPDELVVEALAGENVELGVLGAGRPPGGCWRVIPRVARPLLVVPDGADPDAGRPRRVLAPLDGVPETAAGIAAMARRLVARGAEVSALHVFEPTTVPAFWDQAAHSHRSWTAEFLRRNLPAARDLGLRRGDPAAEVLAELEAGFDALLLGWSQDLSPGRARIVREALTRGTVPMLLVRAPA